ncbi:MAG: IS1380 family transposase [Rhodobacteraceae bacterium]|nr:IS1380 family transposase [Paracoccaceae bacterium]
MTECTQQSFFFHRAGRRQVVARFDGGHISSDGGGVLLREVERHAGIVAQFAACFTDHRDGERIEHRLEHLIGQRVFGLALGYDDLNDHDTLRLDPLLALMVGDDDPRGHDRRRKQDRGKPLAGKSTLNRLELTPVGADEHHRYKKITCSMAKVQRVMVSLFIQEHEASLGVPDEIVLDVDATHDPIHGDQLGKFFHGYYDCHCYLPLYVMCKDFVLAATLRPSNIDAAFGVVPELSRMITQIRSAPGWEHVRIVVRGDSGFCRDSLMNWCETHDVFYLLGLAKNARLKRVIGKLMHDAKTQCEATGQPARLFTEFNYATRKSWSRSRRVIAKAEHLPGTRGENPRFIVTNLPADHADAATLYEVHYCARGDMENRIKEQQLCLFADRLSCQDMRANQLRLYFSTIAYTLLASLRRRALADTELAHAQASTIRTRLLKIGVRIIVTARRLWLSMSQAFPMQHLFAHVHHRLTFAAGP